MSIKIAVIEGDGVGPEVIEQTLKIAAKVNKLFGLNFEFYKFPYSASHYLKTGETIPINVFEEWPKKYSAILFGALGDQMVPDHKHVRDILGGFRRKLDLYINFRPVNLLNVKYCPLKKISTKDQIDFVVFRENIEDIYMGSGGILGKNTKNEVAVENAIHTRKGVERIIRAAFDYALENSRKSVCLTDKSNVMRYVGDLWQRTFYEIGDEYPSIKKKHKYIDALCMDIVRNPFSYEVIVTSNMFGDILTDLAAELQGGIGLAASSNYNPLHKRFYGLFEPVHGSAPDIAGKNIVNPIGTILSFNLLLQRLGYKKLADKILKSVRKSLDENVVTQDLGGGCSTSRVGEFICQEIEKG